MYDVIRKDESSENFMQALSFNAEFELKNGDEILNIFVKYIQNEDALLEIVAYGPTVRVTYCENPRAFIYLGDFPSKDNDIDTFQFFAGVNVMVPYGIRLEFNLLAWNELHTAITIHIEHSSDEVANPKYDIDTEVQERLGCELKLKELIWIR